MATTAKKAKSSLNNLPKDKNGKVIKKGGRAKGVPNKITHEAKEAIALVFEMKGGIQGLFKWATANKTNETIFYSHVYTKLIPAQLKVSGGLDVNVRADAERAAVTAIESALLGVIAAQRNAGTSQASPVIIDAEPNPEPDALLVLSSSGGTKAA